MQKCNEYLAIDLFSIIKSTFARYHKLNQVIITKKFILSHRIVLFKALWSI